MDNATHQYLLAGQRAGMMYALTPPPGAPVGLAGAQLANRPGSSLEFMDHREYQPGDDMRRIDWAAYARTDRLIVKLYRQEVNPHADILVDASLSMRLEATAKHEATVGLAALLAAAAGNAGFSHCLWMGRQGWQEAPNASGPPTEWMDVDLDYAGSPADAMDRRPPSLRAQGVRILISDLLWLGDPLAFLSPLAEKAAAVVIVQLLAEAEVDPPPHGNTRLSDVESGEQLEVFVDAAARRRYRAALGRHQQNWHRAARQVGARMVTLVAERIVTDWQLEPLVAAEILKVAGA